MNQLTPLQPQPVLGPEESKALTASISRALRRAARQARQPNPIVLGGGGMRARKADRLFQIGFVVSFLLCVLLPTVVASAYWGLVASKQYESLAKFTLRSGEASPLDPLGSIASLTAVNQNQDTQVLANFIESPGIIEEIQKKIDIRAAFSAKDVDYFSRIDYNIPIEKLQKYWLKMIDVKVDPNSSIVSLSVRSFSPQDSYRIASEIVSLSERLINELTNRPRFDALRSGERELHRAEENLRKATIAIRDARNEQGVVDANASAEGLNKVITTLRLQLAESEAALNALGTMIRGSPQARVHEAKIAAIRDQITRLNNQIAGPREGASMAARLSNLSKLQTELDIARQQYAQASAVYQTARVELESQKSYIAAFLEPTPAQDSTYPKRWLQWLITVVPCLLLWGLAVIIVFQVRDYMAK